MGPTADYLLPNPLRPLLRMADSVDIRRARQRQNEDKRAWRICRECIDRHGLEMKLIKVEYAPDHSKVTFYFTADGRVDFRDLVKDLAGAFHMRIELRQVGVRRDQDDRRAGPVRPALLLQPVPAQLPPGVHPDGQRAGPVSQPHQDQRGLRAADVLPCLRAGRL